MQQSLVIFSFIHMSCLPFPPLNISHLLLIARIGGDPCNTWLLDFGRVVTLLPVFITPRCIRTFFIERGVNFFYKKKKKNKRKKKRSIDRSKKIFFSKNFKKEIEWKASSKKKHLLRVHWLIPPLAFSSNQFHACHYQRIYLLLFFPSTLVLLFFFDL